MRSVIPLAAYRVLSTTDVDHARACVAASLAPHRLTPVGSAKGFHALYNSVQLGGIGFHYIDYGTAVDVAVDGMDFQLVQIPLAGVITVRHGTDQRVASQRTAVVTAVGESINIRHSVGNPHLLVQIGSDLLRDRTELARRVGILPKTGPASLDMTQCRGRSWRSFIDVLLADLDRERGLTTAPLSATSFETAVVDGLIASLAEDEPQRPAGSSHERVIKRAAQLIDDHCTEPLATADVAEAVGLSVRVLRAGFQEHYGSTPMAYLRQARLRRVHDALSNGRAESVTDAALESGVTHLGRLSVDYRAAFGETPSETLRRAR